MTKTNNPVNKFKAIKLAESFTDQNPTLPISLEFRQALNANYSNKSFNNLYKKSEEILTYLTVNN